MSFLLKEVNESNRKDVVLLKPTPAFVIKSKVIGYNQQVVRTIKLESNVKIFINLCYDDQVPQPDVPFNPNIVYPLIMNNKWEIPIVTSSIRSDVDKKGNNCYVCDCCINTECIDWIVKDLQLREILIEWCLESCEIRESLEISRDHIAFPKLKLKGDSIPSIEILNDELTTDVDKKISDALKPELFSDPSSFFKMKRSLIDDVDDQVMGDTDGELPPLFPRAEIETMSKPLIQELTELDLDKNIKRNNNTQVVERKEVTFDVTMRKTKATDVYKLKIEVVSNINSSLDVDLNYSEINNELIVLNTNLIDFKPKEVKIPLPDIFSKENVSNMKVFFIKSERKMIIYI
ncbi:hypothetical protein TPHA_0D01890 [Tetrapisispora phaffii CBS 4417]|uniref:PIH1 N-terminal domain-containing protein n=1 Tax=Tetrapisispora phaffii (strain ATCC 24235 / CBS 4417 / NBRC 1672 / NRRL Y-8282 / UCD 70-5) TaxID=1071381 RepID=G8BSK7_TETPH|nr:hypothetical protein TPHA_0D01890 [Tetrapisispora phaffii CBS 4417]CCE62828.1 hypothetical protein TPHA_0D01890 [Tetrapisispora phaffii CBS 4417]